MEDLRLTFEASWFQQVTTMFSPSFVFYWFHASDVQYILDYLIDRFENKWVEKSTKLPRWFTSGVEVDCVFLLLLSYSRLFEAFCHCQRLP
jgi:hypothetical protein